VSLKSCPHLLSIDEDAAVGDNIEKEGRFGLSVLQPNHINPTSNDLCELCAEIDDTVQAGIAKIDEDVDITPWRVRPRCG
jgi:hypothetical protein